MDVITAFRCKSCFNIIPQEVSLKQIVTAGFWPGSPTNFLQLFDQDLFEYWDIMQKRMPGVSERSFVMALQDFLLIKDGYEILLTVARIQYYILFQYH